MKKLMLSLLASGLLLLGTTVTAHAANDTAPNTLIHVVTVSWKAGTTPDQVQAALDGVKALPTKFPGIKRVWTKSVKVQGGKANAIVMEFENEAALKEYAGSDAQKEWYKAYTPIRESSTTFDITN
ncbi:MAG TPA: Dabb family protein [Opitutus sp.]|nr:Dabb family protein [Opitutus sp.]